MPSSTTKTRKIEEKHPFLPGKESKKKVLKFMLFNPRSMNNKIGDFIRLLEDNFIDIAFISETWLTQSNNTTTAALKAHGYSLLHTHRVERRGGGTAIIFSANLQLSVKALSGTFKTFEITAGILKSVTGAKILLLALYRTGPLSTLFIQELDALLAEASSLYENIIIGGDLNIHFEHDTANFVEQSMDTFESYTLSPTVMQSTHVNGGWLDELFMHFADSKINKSDVVVDEMNCLGSDHYPVYFNINLEAPKKYYKSVQFRDMKKLMMIFHINSQAITDFKPEMPSGVKTGKRIPHDE